MRPPSSSSVPFPGHRNSLISRWCATAERRNWHILTFRDRDELPYVRHFRSPGCGARLIAPTVSCMSEALEFWFDFASTYSYLSSVRLAHRKDVAWRPFLLGPVFHDIHGTADSPFNRNEPRRAYMWRDVAREANALGVAFHVPSVFPRGSLLATRVALLAEAEPWIGPFVRSVFEANFVDDRDISDEGVVVELLRAQTKEAEAFLTRAKEPATKARLFERTKAAKERGIFGAPTFFVKGELFWGNDRLTEASHAAGKWTQCYECVTPEAARAFAQEWLPAWTGNDPDRLCAFYTDDALYLDPAVPAGIRGQAAIRTYFAKLLSRNPAWVWTQREAIPMKDGFVNLWHASIPGKGATHEVDGVCLVTLREGRISRNEVYFDRSPLFAAR